jgi:uncharacterized protein involved in type VI secretion and phage assembly
VSEPLLDALNRLFTSPQACGPMCGAVLAIVTDINDPLHVGRVKVKYPGFSQIHSSNWAPVVAPGAGRGRGICFLPEVDDQVLVLFELGDVNRPYVLGGLWSRNEEPPTALIRGKRDLRVITSRSGHTIRMTDTAGQEQIEIFNKLGACLIRLDAQGSILIAADRITVDAIEGDLELNARNVTITASNAVKVEAKGNVAVQSTEANLKLAGRQIDIN